MTDPRKVAIETHEAQVNALANAMCCLEEAAMKVPHFGGFELAAAVALSQAISLKRIADALETKDKIVVDGAGIAIGKVK